MDRAELVEELTALLEAERAGARVGASLVDAAPDAEYAALAKVIQTDEVKWAKALFEALAQLGAEPSNKVGDFYDKAMAVPDFEHRLAFTNRGQAWVVRRLNALVPRVADAGLAGMLQAMLDAHVENIGAANDALAEVFQVVMVAMIKQLGHLVIKVECNRHLGDRRTLVDRVDVGSSVEKRVVVVPVISFDCKGHRLGQSRVAICARRARVAAMLDQHAQVSRILQRRGDPYG